MIAQGGLVKYFGATVALVYALTGIYILWKSSELSNFLNGYSIPLGILFILYGIFRGYRVFQRYF